MKKNLMEFWRHSETSFLPKRNRPRTRLISSLKVSTRRAAGSIRF